MTERRSIPPHLRRLKPPVGMDPTTDDQFPGVHFDNSGKPLISIPYGVILQDPQPAPSHLVEIADRVTERLRQELSIVGVETANSGITESVVPSLLPNE
jgi:hypothetical protein